MAGRRVLQRALLVVLLVGGIVLGLLGMHALDTHGTPGAHAMAGHAAPVPAHPSASAVHAVSVAEAAVAPDDSAGDGGAACVLALLGGLLLVLHPTRAAVIAPLLRTLRVRAGAAAAPLRPPSLHVLCISRT